MSPQDLEILRDGMIHAANATRGSSREAANAYQDCAERANRHCPKPAALEPPELAAAAKEARPPSSVDLLEPEGDPIPARAVPEAILPPREENPMPKRRSRKSSSNR